MKQKLHKLLKEERLKVIERLAGAIERRSEIVFANAFGSFVEETPFHDIDIGVYLRTNRDLSYAVELAAELEKEAGFPVDVRILNSAPVSFLYHAIKGVLLLDRDEDMRAEIVEQTVRRYLDIKPIIKKAIREAFAA